MNSTKAFAPATIANFNVGYDVLGLSLNGIGDEVELTINGTEENRIIHIKNGAELPMESEKNCCSVVIRAMQENLGEFRGVDISILKGFDSGSGLGSSSASSAAAAFGYNSLVGNPFGKKELIVFAAEGERVACGSAHIDNVAPSILGGFVLANSNDPNNIIELPIIENLFAVTLFPKIKINTSDSRKILKKNIPLETVSRQIGLMGAFISSLYDNNLERFSYSMQDLIIEPMRSLLIPQFKEMKAASLKHNALAFGISGSGPSVFAITEGVENTNQVLMALKEVCDAANLETQTYTNALIKNSGARLIK
ncbi:MAG: homoserine kinase [Crocinitomicaceae bacterium]|nr:homoserine kinase [Flavobacteriales bacterium]NQZ36644.1 homoserine kinase [Crocinitomicaceae bacterium]